MIGVVGPIILWIAAAHGDLMTPQADVHDPGENSHAARLPYEANSSSELLSANHVFFVEIISVTEAPWTPGNDGLDHRGLRMNAKLLEVFKGALDLALNKSFPLEVQQNRESAYTTSDYHGLWSHIDPRAGSRYLVFADTSSGSPAALMQEGACERILAPDYVLDVRLATEGESLVQQSHRADQESGNRSGAVQALLRFSNEQRSRARDLYERYMWARIHSTFEQKEPHVLAQVLDLVTGPNGTLEFRSSLISQIYDTTVDLQPDTELSKRVLRVFFGILLQSEAASLRPHLAEVELYGLVFEDDKPAFAADFIFPEPKERERLRAVLARFDSERAHALAAWLSAR